MNSTAAASTFSLIEHGLQQMPELALSCLGELAALADELPGDSAGSRLVGNAHVQHILSEAGPVTQAVRALMGLPVQPVRAILFDKNDATNWALGWHQDRTIAVRQRLEVPGFGPWTTKQGICHVQPPFAITAAMVTLRLHLDPVDSSNAPLLVAIGSQKLGFVPVEEMDRAVARHELYACEASAGDAWLYATSILHASARAAPGHRRRVLQVDFSASALPDGLEWLGI